MENAQRLEAQVMNNYVLLGSNKRKEAKGWLMLQYTTLHNLLDFVQGVFVARSPEQFILE